MGVVFATGEGKPGEGRRSTHHGIVIFFPGKSKKGVSRYTFGREFSLHPLISIRKRERERDHVRPFLEVPTRPFLLLHTRESAKKREERKQSLS